MTHIDPCIQAIVEVLKKSVKLTRRQVATLLGLMDVSSEHEEGVIAEAIARGLIITTGHSIRLA